MLNTLPHVPVLIQDPIIRLFSFVVVLNICSLPSNREHCNLIIIDLLCCDEKRLTLRHDGGTPFLIGLIDFDVKLFKFKPN